MNESDIFSIRMRREIRVAAQEKAAQVNRSVSNYLETLVMADIGFEKPVFVRRSKKEKVAA
jgi:hypothetical protein